MAPFQAQDWMPFRATETILNSKRTIQIIVQDFRQNPKTVNLIVQNPLPESQNFPVAYEYVDSTLYNLLDIRSPRKTALRIVAGPGVSVHLESWPNQDGVLLDVYRVQDPEIVPKQATTILSNLYTPPQEINPPQVFYEESIPPWQYPLDYFVLETKPWGLLVIHPHSTLSLALTYASTTTSLENTEDAKTRFCYQVIHAPSQSPFEAILGGGRATFTIVKTPNVKVAFRGGPPKFKAMESLFKTSQYFIPFRIFEAPDILSIPPQGASVSARDGWRDVTSGTSVKRDLIDRQSYDMLRFYLGFVPVVNEIIDIAEFMLVSATGKDFMGQELSDAEKAVLGLNIIMDILPLSSSSVLKVFKRKTPTVIKLTKAVRKAAITTEERVVLQKAKETLHNGGKLAKEEIQVLNDIVKKLPTDTISIDSILNAERTGFSLTELQEGYQKEVLAKYEKDLQGGYEKYVNKKTRRGDPQLSPEEWAKAQTKPPYSDILEKLLGTHYRNPDAHLVNLEEVFNLTDIMRPVGYTDEMVKEHLSQLLKENTEFAKKLNFLIKDLESVDEAVAFAARQQMSKGRFNSVKGFIGEAFARPEQMRVLREVSETEPKALLYTGVTIQRKGANQAVLFTDNIIAVPAKDSLNTRVVFEIKSGKRGGYEATVQVHEWVEGRLEEGDLLIIPKGSKYYNAKGTEMKLEKEIRVIYGIKPTEAEVKAGVGEVVGLARAERRIISAKGTSLLGLNSEDQIGAAVKRADLPLSSSQIDYLGGQLVKALGERSGLKLPQ